MAVKVGKQLLCNVPDAISYLYKKYEELNVKVGTKLYLHRVKCTDMIFGLVDYTVDFYFISSSNTPIESVAHFRAALQDPKVLISPHSVIDDSAYADTYEECMFTGVNSGYIYFYSAADDSALSISFSDTWTDNAKIFDTITDM